MFTGVGDIIGKVIEGAYQIIDDTQAIAESVSQMRAIELAPQQEGEAKGQKRKESGRDSERTSIAGAHRRESARPVAAF